MKDAVGQELAVGDVVTFMEMTGVQPSVRLGRVMKFTAQFIVIRPLDKWTIQPGYTPSPWGTRKKGIFVTLVTNQMHHLEDGEIYTHFENMRKGA